MASKGEIYYCGAKGPENERNSAGTARLKEIIQKARKTNAGIAAVSAVNGAAALGVCGVLCNLTNDGSPMVIGMAVAVYSTAKALAYTADTKLVKAVAHGIKNGSKTVWDELTPQRKAICAQVKKFKGVIQQRVQDFNKGDTKETTVKKHTNTLNPLFVKKERSR